MIALFKACSWLVLVREKLGLNLIYLNVSNIIKSCFYKIKHNLFFPLLKVKRLWIVLNARMVLKVKSIKVKKL